MSISWTLTVTVLAMLFLERVAIIWMTGSEAGRQRVRDTRLLHPNSISLIRIPMGLISVGVWLGGWPIPAIVWFSFWMITDLTDGTIARRCDLTTERGKWLDPLSDKCMYFPVLAMFCRLGALPLLWVTATLIIDALGQASRLLIKKKAANHFGKAKTALITVVISLAALHELDPQWFMSPRFFALLMLSCTILAFLSVFCKVIPDEWYANSLTLANFLCGLGAIYNVTQGRSLTALVLVFVGQFFDLFDGRLALKYGSTRFGAIYDDIADATSFGGAIAFIIVQQLGGGQLAVAIGVVYFVAVMYRLYRFLHPDPGLPKGIFRGVPSPAGGLGAGVAALLFGADHRWLAVALILLSCVLMVSRIPYRHLGHRMWPSLPRGVKLVFFVTMLLFVNISIADRNYRRAFLVFCSTLAGSYSLFGVDYTRLRNRRRGGEDRPPATEPD